MRCNSAHIAILILSPVLFAGPSPTNDQATRLLKGVAADARQIQNAATELEKLTKDSNATWQQFDRQWNELQPAVETMHMKIARLEAMESSLSASEKQALNQSKADYQKIAWQSRELGNMVDKVPVDLSTPKLKIESRELVKEAGEVAHTAKTSI